MHVTRGSMRHAGNAGYLWTDVAYSSELHAYNLGFSNANVLPSGSDVRWYGFTVRVGCL